MNENIKYVIRRLFFKRSTIMWGTIFLVMGLLMLISKEFFLQFQVIEVEPLTFFLVFISFTLIGTGLLLFAFLQGDFYQSKERNEGYIDLIHTVKSQLLMIENKIDNFIQTKGVELELNENDKKEIFDTFSKSIKEKLDSKLLTAIEEKYSPAILKSNQYSKLMGDFKRVIDRLEHEMRRLSTKASLNLTIGTLITIVAAGSLGYIVFTSNIDFSNTLQLTSHYIPRISLIIFIEIFAYFFLKLYKLNLDDIKYYQGEMINVESKFISLKSAFMVENEEVLKISLIGLSKTEKNFTLTQGKSMVELEKIKSENKNVTQF